MDHIEVIDDCSVCGRKSTHLILKTQLLSGDAYVFSCKKHALNYMGNWIMVAKAGR